jgi:hypothetical protein
MSLQSSETPLSLVDIELHQTFVSHFQQQRLAGFLIRDIGAFHDFVGFERLLTERTQDIFSIIQHGSLLQSLRAKIITPSHWQYES